MRLMGIILFILCLMLTATHTSPSYAGSPWPQFMHDARHTGRSEYIIPDKIKVLWVSDFALQKITGMSISVDGGTIYAGSMDHGIYAINAANGSVAWQYLADHEIVGTPAVDQDGNIYAGSKDDHLYCLKPDGTLNWKYKLVSDVIFSPLLGALGPLNVVIVGTENRLYAILDGKSLWTDPFDLLDGRIYKSWSAGATFGSDATIYSPGDAYSNFIAIDPDGEIKWWLDINSPGGSTPTVGDNGIIYLPTSDQTGSDFLTAINPNGTEAWSFPMQDGVSYSDPVTGPDGTIYIGCNDSYLYAIKKEGTLKWRYLMSSSMAASSFAIDANGSVLTVSSWANSPLVALDSNGNLKWKVFPGYEFASQMPIIGKDGIVFISNHEGIVAINQGENTELRVSRDPVDNSDSGGGGGGGGGGIGCFISTMKD